MRIKYIYYLLFFFFLLICIRMFEIIIKCTPCLPDNSNKSFSGYFCLSFEIMNAFSRSFALQQILRALSFFQSFLDTDFLILNLFLLFYQVSEVCLCFFCLIFISLDIRPLLLSIYIPTVTLYFCILLLPFFISQYFRTISPYSKWCSHISNKTPILNFAPYTLFFLPVLAIKICTSISA